MANPKIEDQQLLETLLQVFRRHGFQGTSLSRLAKATGLQRASLYHRFPGGKEEMAERVLGMAGERVQALVLAPLQSEGKPLQRIRRMIRGVHEFYQSGEQPCLIESLTVGVPSAELERGIEGAVQSWIRALAEVIAESGISKRQAQERAEEAVILIQGALVVSRALKDTGPFERILKTLPERLLEARESREKSGDG